MKRLNITLVIFILPILIYAQDCSCEKNFQWMKETFEKNDAGFSYVIEKKGQDAYEVLNDETLKAITSAKNKEECATLLRDWLSFFRKGHLKLKVADQENEIDKSTENLTPSFKKISENTLIFKIPSFDYKFKTQIDSLITANQQYFDDSKNLIIDLRDNRGGSDASYQKILPYLYTNPIRTVGAEFLSTKLNNETLKKFLVRPENSENQNKSGKKSMELLNKNLGGFVNIQDNPIFNYELDTIKNNPKNVAILINGINGSSVEQFLLSAKQSKKVKLFGTTTAGVLDISNMNYVNSPCTEFSLGYGLSRSLRIPEMAIDNIGIQPDFFIDKFIASDKWIEFVEKVLNKE